MPYGGRVPHLPPGSERTDEASGAPGTPDGAAGDAVAAAERAGVVVRTLHSHADLDGARRLWDTVWPSPTSATEVTANHLRAIEHAGGYVAGAFDGLVMVGAALAFVGRSRTPDGFRTHLHSHMAAVLPVAADRGVGTALKLHQRAWALVHGIDRVVWTFDPLVRRNARLNLTKLGGVAVEYLVDFYGPMDDPHNVGEPSDRLLLAWDLASPRVAAALAGTAPALPAAAWAQRGAERVLDDVDGPRRRGTSAPLQLVALPADIVALRHDDPARAAAWRAAVRDLLAPALDAGGSVGALTAEGDYVLAVG